jgi:hypothetical protein
MDTDHIDDGGNTGPVSPLIRDLPGKVEIKMEAQDQQPRKLGLWVQRKFLVH